MNLLPLYLNNNSIRGNIEELNRYHVMDCIECGSCAYVCPAKINLVQSIRLGKAQVRQAAAKGEINLERSFIVSSSPHIRDNISTRRIMLDVIIALIPASLQESTFSVPERCW